MFLRYRLWELYVNIHRFPWSSSFGHLSRHNLVNLNLYASQHWRINDNPRKRVDSKKKYLHNCIELHVYLSLLIFYIVFLSKISLYLFSLQPVSGIQCQYSVLHIEELSHKALSDLSQVTLIAIGINRRRTPNGI